MPIEARVKRFSLLDYLHNDAYFNFRVHSSMHAAVAKRTLQTQQLITNVRKLNKRNLDFSLVYKLKETT